MDEKQCEIYRKNLEEKIDVHDRRLNAHSDRLDALENYRSALEERIKNLVEKIDKLTNSNLWLSRAIWTAVIGFVVYVIKMVVEK